MSAEFDQLPGGWGLKKLIFPAGYLNEILKAVPGERPIKTVESLRKNLSRLGWELSKYVEGNPWMCMQFSVEVWNSQGSRSFVSSPLQSSLFCFDTGSGSKRTRDQAGKTPKKIKLFKI